MTGDARSVFVDTSAWFASFDARDARWSDATRLFEVLVEMGARLLTSNFVLAETHAMTVRRCGRDRGVDVVDRFHRGTVRLVRVSEADEVRAVEIIEGFADKAFSYTDATSFAIIERLGIQSAFSFDRHFAQFGVTTLGLDG